MWKNSGGTHTTQTCSCLNLSILMSKCLISTVKFSHPFIYLFSRKFWACLNIVRTIAMATLVLPRLALVILVQYLSPPLPQHFLNIVYSLCLQFHQPYRCFILCASQKTMEFPPKTIFLNKTKKFGVTITLGPIVATQTTNHI